MSQEALIIFVRKPEAGRVKTRIAAEAGADTALLVYEKLLEHTYVITQDLMADKYVFYADGIVDEDLWSNGIYYKDVQRTGDLGNRMPEAFRKLFQKGYTRICIIGSDCYELRAELIERAFAALHTHDLVIGPAADGGYYLLGMRDALRPIFHAIDWSTEKVMLQTLDHIEQGGYSYTLLPVLRDVDTLQDVPQEWMSTFHRR